MMNLLYVVIDYVPLVLDLPTVVDNISDGKEFVEGFFV